MHHYPPLVRQATCHTCGQACALSIMANWGAYDGPECNLHVGEDLERGCDADRLVKLFKDHKLSARHTFQTKVPTLRRWLRSGASVMIAIQAWPDDYSGGWSARWDDGHWVVLCELTRKDAIVMDPSVIGQYATLPIEEMVERWHDLDDNLGQLQGIAVVVRGKNKVVREGLLRCG